jgi:outer membrane protein assembly factor BamB
MRLRPTVFGFLLVLGVAVHAAAGARPRCAPGRFVVDAATPLGTAGIASVVWHPGTLAVANGCPPAAVHVTRTARGTRLRARWASCPGFAGRVSLTGTIAAPACDAFTGTLETSGAAPHHRRVSAVRTPFDPDVPLDPRSPWPKFRGDSVNDGRSPLHAVMNGARPWTFPTGKGVFSSPVVGGDGSVYVGSADRTFYALAADGSVRWSVLTGEIIDSAALLDDRGRVYVGSGDGHLYAFDATTGTPVWTFAADPPSTNGAFIDWFEGNVAIEADGTLLVPNDNFFTYALDRDTRAVRWHLRTADQTWSLPAVDVPAGRVFVGNNNLLKILGDNTFALDAATGARVWSHGTDGTIAASPMLTANGLVVVGGFDGFVRAYDRKTGALQWQFGARDHIYASPAALPDGTVIQASADGSVYALAPDSGALVWQFDTRDAIRSSPAVDADGHVYVGSGEGRLFVLNADGTLRWSMKLIDAERDDLNASPALGREAIVIAGESGEVFSIPYDWCLRPEAAGDGRCRLGPGEDLPDEGAHLFFTTPFGRQLPTPPAQVDANQPLTYSLYVRRGGDTQLALIDSPSVTVTLDPPVPVRTEVSGDRKFITIVPTERLMGPAGGTLTVSIHGQYLIDPDRTGLRFTGGTVGGTFDEVDQFTVPPAASGGVLPLPVPSAPGDPAGLWELSRLAAPLPTVLPSYNQIGFDSLHYLLGLVEGDGAGHAVVWVVGGKLAEGENRTVVDPTTRVLFPLEATYDGGLLTLANDAGFAIEFNRIRLPFDFFRVATRVDAGGTAVTSPAINVLAVCSGITLYGVFLEQLGFCNPQTDILDVFGGADLGPHESGIQQAPAGVGTVAFAADAGGVTATLTGSTLTATDHSVGVLLVDVATGKPVSLDYGYVTTRTPDADGHVESVRVAFTRAAVPDTVRAYLMVDAYPAARATLAVPPGA